MTSTRYLAAFSALACAAALSLSVHAQNGAADGPRYDGNRLVRPANYREWVFLGSSLGLTYAPPSGGSSAPSFGNVFVNPSSYRAFQQKGKWPDKTMFVLEVRRSSDATDLVKGGRFQSDLLALEANVKDSRFPDGWAFVTWGRAPQFQDAANPLSQEQSKACVECHTSHAAVERTFGQFYPTVLEIARQKGTLKPGF